MYFAQKFIDLMRDVRMFNDRQQGVLFKTSMGAKSRKGICDYVVDSRNMLNVKVELPEWRFSNAAPWLILSN
jgi:hypothetical protein